MTEWFRRELTTLAFCWRLQRRDGIALGFTSHDRDLVIDGLRYRAAPGLLPSAIERTDGFEPDRVELTGGLASDLIAEPDLRAGRWDGAALTLFAADWSDPTAPPLFLARGTLGEIDHDGRGFSAELVGAAARLEQPLTEYTSPECRATLGDRRCRVDLAGRRTIARVIAAEGEAIRLDRTLEEGAYASGRLRWLDGENAGLDGLIESASADTLVLAEPPPGRVNAGDRAEITQGCDRRLDTCVARFANAANFRGEPFLPGSDLLVRYA